MEGATKKIIRKGAAGADYLTMGGTVAIGALSHFLANWAKDHPKSSAAAALLIWYSTDPEGCTDAVGDVSEFLAGGGTEILTEAVSRSGKGISETLAEKWQEPSRQYFLVGLAAMLLLPAICIRFIRRMIFFPFRMMSLRLNAFMDRKEAQLEQKIISRLPGTERKKNFPFRKKPDNKSSVSRSDDDITGLF